MALQRITVTSTDRVCILLVGPAGSGKTSQIRCLLGQDYQGGEWVRTTMEPERVLVLSAESGLLCIRDLVASGVVEGFEIRSLAEFQEALRFCQGNEFREAGYRWVFIDSLTEIAARCVEAFQARYPNKADSWNLWREYSATMTTIIKEYRDMASVNVVFTCLVGQARDDVGRVSPAPDVQGSGLKNRLAAYFDEVLYLDQVKDENGNMTRVFKTRAPLGLAKDRSGLLAELEYPNLLMVRDKIIH